MLLDQEVIDELKMVAGDAPELLDEIVDAYLLQLPDFLHGIHQGVKNQDGEQLNQSAHSLKGASYNMGAAQVGKLCAILEQQGKDSDFANAAQLLPDLEQASQKTITALQTLKSA